MYRKPGSQSALSGVLSGPYTGGRRIVDAARLNDATRKRLSDALAGDGDGALIAETRERSLGVSGRGLLAIAIAIVIVVFLFQIGFEDRGSSWAYQPTGALGIYGVAGLCVSFGLLDMLRVRALTGRGALRAGHYLLPLDIVDVSKPDPTGAQRIELTPLGDARDVKVKTEPRATELVISFADATTRTFVLRGASASEIALRRLEHTQELLEELTYVSELGKAFARDPFFDVRVDGSWAEVAPDAAKRGAPKLRLFHRAASVVAVVVGCLFGFLVFHTRNSMNDERLLVRAMNEGTIEALDAYVARGGRQTQRVAAMKGMLLAQREREAKEKADREAKEKASRDGDVMNGIGEGSKGSRAACTAALESRKNPKRPEVTRALAKLLAASDTHPVVPIRFKRKTKRAPQRLYGIDDHLTRRELTIARVFEHVFSEVCAGNVLRFVYDAADDGTALVITYELSWPEGDERLYAMHAVFDVTFHGSGEQSSFQLTMPAAKSELSSLRPKSIFTLPKTSSGDELLFYAMTARAFDRLYDEIWSLFFAGDPRIPIADEMPP